MSIASNIENNSIRSFAEAFQEPYSYRSDIDNAHLWFACHSAFFPAFTVDILEKIWINFRDEKTDEREQKHKDVNLVFPHVVVADLINSNLCEKLGRNLFSFNNETQGLLRGFLTEHLGVNYVTQIASFIRNYQNSNSKYITSSSLRKSLEFTADLYLDRDKIAKELINYFNEVVKREKSFSGIDMSLGLIKSANKTLAQTGASQRDNLFNVEQFIDGLLSIKRGDREGGITKLKGISDFLESGLNNADKGITTLLEPSLVKELNLEVAVNNNNNRIIKGNGVCCIFIGNSDYSSEEIPSLSEVKLGLIRMNHFVKSKLKCKSIISLFNASKQQIIEAFEDLRKDLVDGDTLLFYYAGYGGLEIGSIEKYDKFITCSDFLQEENEFNRLSHLELRYLFLKCFEKKIEIVSILDCGYALNLDINLSKSLPVLYSKRSEKQLIYNNRFRPEEIWNYNLTSFVIGYEENFIIYNERVGVVSFIDSFIPILLKKKNDSDRVKITLKIFKEEYEKDNLVRRPLTIWNYPNQNEEHVLFENYYLNENQRIDAEINENQLNLSGLRLGRIPKFEELTNVTSLNLSRNEINNILILKEFKNLTSLNLSRNKIRNISILKELKNLTSLNLSRNRISDISVLEELENLQSLDLSDNIISDISFLKNLKNLTSLSLRLNKVSDISVLKELKSLISLNLDGNYIRDYEVFRELENLTSLSLSNNNLSGTAFLHKLKNLTSLNLSMNNLERISVLREFRNLISLNLRSNRLIDISALEKLRSLTSLNLSRNRLIDISVLEKLINLISLNLRSNRLIDISALEKLRSLTSLNLSDNIINDIKPLIYLLKNGLPIRLNYKKKCILIKDNPLDNPSIEIVKEGNKAILNYFDEKGKQGTTALYEAKVIIIGEGGVGKTSLARRLISGDKAILPSEREITRGIDISEYNFKTKEGKDFKLNLWDFGGQEIYHSTHQFFFTKRTLYVLVCDTRKDDKISQNASLNYWLETVELLSENSPIIIVQNEVDDRSKNLEIEEISERYENVKGYYKTNLLTYRGVDKIKERIEGFVQSMPDIGQELPRKWINIRQELEALSSTAEKGARADYIDLRRYLAICAKHDIVDEKTALLLSEYLHDLGVFLHFQDDGLLRNIFILNSEWATGAVYKLLDNEVIRARNGRFSIVTLKTVWSDNIYLNKYSELLRLMEKFELIFKIPNSQDRIWLALPLLSIEPKFFSWEEKGNLQLKYSYAFLPKGTISRLMVRLSHLIIDYSTSWLGGFFLQDQAGNTALIEEKYGKNEISIRVSGVSTDIWDSRRDLMAVIIEAFEDLHKTYGSKLRVEKKVPCICDTCKNSDIPNYYNYSNLALRNEKNQPTVECSKSYENVLVKQVLRSAYFQNVKKEKKLIELIQNGDIQEAIESLEQTNLTKSRLSRFMRADKDFQDGLVSKEELETTKKDVVEKLLDDYNKGKLSFR